MTDAPFDKIKRFSALSRVFTPNAPVTRRDLFRGRLDQIFQIAGALNQPGLHVVLYGERGVGKTSLANLLADFLFTEDRGEVLPTVRVNCATQDSYRSIWTKVFRELRLEVPAEWDERPPDPDDIRWALAPLVPERIIVLDEFDRVEDDECLSLMADTVKSLSDHLVATKVVIVGVADSIDQLIGEHESVQRCIEEVPMPRMTEDNVFEIVDSGLASVEMTAELPARLRISRLCEGLPHYAHLLTLYAAERAVGDDRDRVLEGDVKLAVERAATKHSLVKEYQTAIQSARTDTLYSRVLASCALADKNRLGYFTAGAVREPMSRIMRRPYKIQAFAPHLDAFTSDERGRVLRREGKPRHYLYRFRNPLLQPFAIFAALAEGALPEDYAAELFSGAD